MPPKAKFSKEEIVGAALDLVRERGIQAVTARELGARLGSSARPVFTVFRNMEEVQQEVVAAAKVLYKRYVEQGLEQDHRFRGVGIMYIRFAMEEPKLFQLLFMTEQEAVPDINQVLGVIDDNTDEILLSAQRDYDLDEACARQLYRHLWIYSHGIAALCATKVCRFEEDEIAVMLAQVCTGILKNMKAGEGNDKD